MSLDGESSMEPGRCAFLSFFLSAKIICCVISLLFSACTYALHSDTLDVVSRYLSFIP